MQANKKPKKQRLYNIIISDQMAADLKEIRKDGIVISCLLRKAMDELIKKHKNGERLTVPNL